MFMTRKRFSDSSLNDLACSILLVAGVAISTIHSSFFYYKHDQPKWFVFEIALSLVAAILLWRQKKFTLGPVAFLCSFLMLLMLCSFFWAVHIYSALEFVIQFFLMCSVVYFLSYSVPADKLLKYGVIIVVVSAVAFLALYSVERGIFRLPQGKANFSSFGFVNYFGHVANIWIPMLMLPFALKEVQVGKKLLLFVLLVALASILVHGWIRASLLGLFLGELTLFCVLSFYRRKAQFQLLAISCLLAFSLGLMSILNPPENSWVQLKKGQTREVLSTGGVSKAFPGRINMISNTWEMILDKPLGVGINNFEYIHPYYGKAGTPQASFAVSESTILRTPHNFLLKMFSEMGFLGGLVCCLLYALMGVVALINALRGEYKDQALFIALFAVLFNSMFSAVFLNPASLFFSTLLFALVLSRHAVLMPDPKVISPKVISAGAISAEAINAEAINAEVISSRAIIFGKISTWLSQNATLNICKAKIMVLILLAVIPIVSAVKLFSHYSAYSGLQQKNEALLLRAVRYYPGNERAWFDLAFVRKAKNRPAEASVASLEKFLSLYPYHIGANYLRAVWLYQMGAFDEAEAAVLDLLVYYPGFKKARQLLRHIQTRRKRARNSKP